MNKVSYVNKNKLAQSVFKVCSKDIFLDNLVSFLDKNDKLSTINNEIELFIDGKTKYKAYNYRLIIEKEDKEVEGILIVYHTNNQIFLLIDQHTYAFSYLSEIITSESFPKLEFEQVKRDINVDFLYWILSNIYYDEKEIINNDNETLTLIGLNRISGELRNSSRGTISSSDSSSIDNIISTLAFISERKINNIGISIEYKSSDNNYFLLFSMSERGIIYTYKNSCTLDNGKNQSSCEKMVEILLLIELIILPLLTNEYQNNCHTLFNESNYLWDNVKKNQFLDDVMEEIMRLIEQIKAGK